MITDAILSFFLGIARGVLGLLPDIQPPDLVGMVDGIAPLFAPATGYLGWLNKYLPIDQAALALGVVLGSWLVLYGIRLVVWVLTKAHVLGGE